MSTQNSAFGFPFAPCNGCSNLEKDICCRDGCCVEPSHGAEASRNAKFCTRHILQGMTSATNISRCGYATQPSGGGPAAIASRRECSRQKRTNRYFWKTLGGHGFICPFVRGSSRPRPRSWGQASPNHDSAGVRRRKVTDIIQRFYWTSTRARDDGGELRLVRYTLLQSNG